MSTGYSVTEENGITSTEIYVHELELQVKELNLQLAEMNNQREKEYFARLNAELEARTAKEAFKALVKELVDIRQQ